LDEDSRAVTIAFMRFPLAAAVSLAVLVHLILGQSSDTFEAASIRPSGPDSTVRSKVDRSQFVATRHTLAMLISSSYSDLPTWRVSGGPSWATKDPWDFVAKLPPGMPNDQEQLYRKTEQMLRTLLAEEFKLKTHVEAREQPVYDLVTAKGGPKLKRSEAAQFSYRVTPGGVEFRYVVIHEFVSFLYCPNCTRQFADRVVIDKTGLTGYYDFTLNWAPSNSQSDTVVNPGPSIFTAVEEQLGLKLEPRKGPVDFLVIDQAERPSQN
jgi:uncharacterized protein (TIGR03435 family)